MLTALTPSKAWSERHGQRHRTVTERACLMLLALHRWLPGRSIVAVMDGEFAALELLHELRARMAIITRLRKDARLFDPPPCHDGKPGRAPRKGRRQPPLSERIVDPATRWQRVVQASRTSWRRGGWIEYAHGTALWHHGGKPIVPILWVLVRYPDGRREPEALCTDTRADPRDVLDCFNRRWAMETTYEEARAHLGNGDAAPVVGPGGVPDNAAAARPLQRGHAACAPECRAPGPVATPGRLVSEASSDLCRRPRPAAPAPLVRAYRHVGQNH